MKAPARLFLAFLGPVLLAAPAAAQTSDQYAGVSVRVEVDRPVYGVGETVTILVRARNDGAEPVVLNFSSTQQADYVLDGDYVWSARRSFADVPTSIRLEPGEDQLIHDFRHLPSDFPLAPGTHVVEGSVKGYGKAFVAFTVLSDSSGTGSSTFRVDGFVRPPQSPLGAPVAFRATVTNTGSATATFGVDGCPVHYTLDGSFRPMWACAEFYRPITLQPGESVAFTAEEDDRLIHDGHDYPLGPGPHSVHLEIPGVGGTDVPFTVDRPDPAMAYGSGRITTDGGSGTPSAVVTIVRASNTGTLDLPPDEERYQAVTGNEGYFFFAGIHAGTYRMVVEHAGVSIWYPGTTDPARAGAITLDAGAYRAGLDLVVPGGPPWPPGGGVLAGRVVENGATGSSAPVEGAWVAAVPVARVSGDTIPPWGSGTALDILPQDLWSTVTGADGSYALQVPFGEYRLLAGREDSHRYRYWAQAATWDAAEIIGVWGLDKAAGEPLPGFHFTLPRESAPAPALLRGRVLGQHPWTDSLPHPVAGATVVAWSLEPWGQRVVAETHTDANGDYELSVDWDSPHRVLAWADGYEQRWFNGQPGVETADGVDVVPGATTSGLDFVLPMVIPPPEGTIRGSVSALNPKSGDVEPLADAWVVAVPADFAVDDSVVIGPDGESRPGAGWSWPQLYFGTTGADGNFTITAPPGSYRLVATHPGHRYQYWSRASRWQDATITTVYAWPADAEPPEIFHAFELSAGGTGWAQISGRVIDDNPLLGRPPMPIEGARVTAVPLGGFFLDILLQAETDAGGNYSLRVPGDMPCLVFAEAEGFVTEYFDNAPVPALATGVDVEPDATAGPIDFGLGPVWTPPPPAVLRGTVYATSPGSTGEPLAGAWVSAIPVTAAWVDSVPGDDGGVIDPSTGTPDDGGFPYLTFTAEDGTYALEVPAGLYRVLAGDRGAHAYRYWDHVARWNEGTFVDTWAFVLPPPGSPVPLLDFHLPPAVSEAWAVLRGQVLAFDPVTDGPPRPLAGARLMAVPAGASYERMIFIGTSDENGFYEIGVPARCPWRVEARADGYQMQYFRDKAALADADGIDVHPGEPTPGIDFVLRPSPGPGAGIIEGRVYEQLSGVRCPDGTRCTGPAAGVLVRVEAAYPTFAPYVRETITDRSGYFRVGDLAASDDGSLSYYVSALRDGNEPLFYPGGVPYPGAVPLPVYPGQVSSAGILTIPAGGGGGSGSVAGRIVDARDVGIPGATVRLYLKPDSPAGPVVTGMTREDGSFSFGSLPEGIPVVVAADAEGYVPAYFPGVHRWRDAARATTGSPVSFPAPVVFALRSAVTGGPFIQAGRVRTDGAEEPVDSTVVPLGELPRVRAMQYHAINVARAHFYLVNALSLTPVDLPIAGGVTGDNGTVILTGLPEGTYFAYADRPGYETAYFAVAPDASPLPIFLNGGTPAVLAEIRLTAIDPGGSGEALEGTMVSDLMNAPNPFRPRTVIHFNLHGEEPVTVQIFDFQGRLVRCLAEALPMSAGERAVTWDGTDGTGRPVGAGVYFYRVKAGEQAVSRKMVLMPQ